jgi:hypothetical protein
MASRQVEPRRRTGVGPEAKDDRGLAATMGPSREVVNAVVEMPKRNGYSSWRSLEEPRSPTRPA